MTARRTALVTLATSAIAGPSVWSLARATTVPAASPRYTLDVRLDLWAEIAAGRFDPTRHRVGLRGSHPPLSWGRSWPLTPQEDGRFWIGRVPFDSAPFGDQPLAWKARIDGPGAPGEEGWEPGPNHRVRLLAATVVERAFAAAPVPLPPRRTGWIERWAAISAEPLAQREIQVWRPPGFDAARRYPLVLMHDGQNLFDDAAAGGEWMLDETAERLVREGAIEPPLIVAVASTATRLRDYTPWPGRMGHGPGSEGGGGMAYAGWIERALLPELERRLPLAAGPERRFVGGSSLGGLLSAWMLLAQPGLWGGALVVSPSVWWAGERLLEEIPPRPAGSPPLRLWLDIGEREGAQAAAGAERLHERLRARGWAHRYLRDPAGGHDEASWAARGEGMLRFLFGPS